MHFLSSTMSFALLISLATAGDHHSVVSSYSVITKHDAPHHYDGKQLSGGHDDKYGYDSHEPHHIPNYSFKYGVKDSHTGDNKEQWENRHGDHVKGGYSLKESDGTTRIVEYSADDHNGFNAIVKKIGHAQHPQSYHMGYVGDYGYDHGYASSYADVKNH